MQENYSALELKHLAVIMDGNARWAQDNKSLKYEGYRKGAKAAKDLIFNALELAIPYLTIYAFSSENWLRPKDEIMFLMNMLGEYIVKETEELHKNGIRLKVIGKIDRLNASLQKTIYKAIKLTENNSKMTLCVAFGYGGRLEIVDACQKMIDSGVKSVDENSFKHYLYDSEMPDVDLLIRTSGAIRISNFLLWQIAYAELLFCNKYWPDFNKDDLIEAINEYKRRNRNFGARVN